MATTDEMRQAIETVFIEIKEAVDSIREDGKVIHLDFRRRHISAPMGAIACYYTNLAPKGARPPRPKPGAATAGEWRQRNFAPETVFIWKGETRIGQGGKLLFQLYPSEKPIGQEMPDYVEISHTQMGKEFADDFELHMTELLGATFDEMLGLQGAAKPVKAGKPAPEPEPEPKPEELMPDWGMWA
jgi:hypothetical protein